MIYFRAFILEPWSVNVYAIQWNGGWRATAWTATASANHKGKKNELTEIRCRAQNMVYLKALNWYSIRRAPKNAGWTANISFILPRQLSTWSGKGDMLNEAVINGGRAITSTVRYLTYQFDGRSRKCFSLLIARAVSLAEVRVCFEIRTGDTESPSAKSCRQLTNLTQEH